MTVPSINGVTAEIRAITDFLVSDGFVDDQNYPIQREAVAGVGEIIFSASFKLSSAFGNVTYADSYREQLAARAFNFRMLDGALVQMAYRFNNSVISQGRLVFLPSPDLEAFQNDPEVYEEDLMYAEVISKRIFPTPIRFDFDLRPGVAVDIDHPRSHLTLGQYKHCRIAVSAPVTPGVFVGFILRSFYNPALKNRSGVAPCFNHRFEDTISAAESAIVHLAIP
jgi:hypothetical protein